MKGTAITLDVSRIRKLLQQVGILSSTFATLVISTLLFFIILNLASYAQSKMNQAPTSSIKGLAATVSYGFFWDMMGLEVPHLNQDTTQASVLSQRNAIGFLFRLITDVNPLDAKTLLAHEIPGLGNDSAFLLRQGQGTELAEGPQDYMPAKDIEPSEEKPSKVVEILPSTTPLKHIKPSPAPISKPVSANVAPSKKNVVLIYHSHNRESWVPELGIKDPEKAYDETKNITLVGQRLAQNLKDLGIGAVDYSTDYASQEKGYDFIYSYKYSAKTVREAFAANPAIQYVFDIHRDSQNRNITTKTIDGKAYAQVLFIIGQRNPNWELNEKFATKIHDGMDKMMPGISRGIWGKSAHDGNAEYNQSLSPNNILIEIGGPYNTIEECNRTVDLLAHVIADLYMDSEKVDGAVGAIAQK
ncbi:stage II sporulation protein P [Paenibacillus psychroresistens]|uniref:Stage II sporulation protein P n=1 Tax=Paenibacillus psychroresistens TaxID=1778678 RepID=A0A6B8RK19_9BACL|nr:stage II sporulation protein P [Paenibacillus psychroresistens]QGQ95698.1 stage II sporulation protein P [Paenibacillus psychroresistens]